MDNRALSLTGFTMAKRAVDGLSNSNYELPPWALVVVVISGLAFVPAFLYVSISRWQPLCPHCVSYSA